jgi:hypothetical protein
VKRSSFPIFSSHLDLAHSLWKEIVTSDDLVIDCTLGNGYDTQFLVELEPYRIIAIDIQEEALHQAKKRVVSDCVEFVLADHADFPEKLEDQSVKLAVYNLGYLPGGNKSMTTTVEKSLASVQKMAKKIFPGGALSITCYPGHEEGVKEESALQEWASLLSPSEWMVSYIRWLNRGKSPSLLWIVKTIG